MEVVQYLRLARKWLWLIIAASIIGGGVAFLINTGRPPLYQAQVMISIGRFIEARNPNQADINVGLELSQTYAQLVHTASVLEGAIQALDLPLDAREVGRFVNTDILAGTSLLVIRVAYTDAVLAADIANSLADQLILQSPSNLTAAQQAQIDFANSQINALTEQIEQARLELQRIDRQLADANSQTESDNLMQERNTLINQVNEASATVAQFTNTISDLQLNTNVLNIVERARIPSSSNSPSTLAVLLLGGITGAGLAMGAIFLFDYLDETIRTTDEAAQALALPVLGGIVQIGRKNDSYRERLISSMPMMSPVPECYRIVRTNLLFGSKQSDTGIYVITSAGSSEGKSVTASNLAISMATAGLQVLLIDADMRRPKIHEIFDLDNHIGLTTLLSAQPNEPQAQPGEARRRLPVNLMDCIQTTTLPKLWIITSGFTPANPTEILGSSLFQRWIEIFRASSDIDVVLIDTPPSLLVADSSVLAVTAKADVIMVVDSGHTRREAAKKVKEKFQQLGVGIKGVVLNRVNPQDSTYDYGYGYYYSTEPNPFKSNPSRK